MNYFLWLEQERTLTSGALTVRAQTVSPNDNGRLKWEIFFPRRNVDSVDLHEITTVTFRPVADRREWDAPGRKLALRTPNLRDITMIPIEASHDIQEYELQKLAERNVGPNSPQFRAIIAADIPDRVVFLTLANYRRIELDAFRAWANGTTVVRNPANPASAYTVSFGFAAARYATAGTAWNVVANAYTALMDWLRDVAANLVGPVQGIMLRQATLNEIILDAPNPASPGVQATIPQVEQRIQDTLGTAFRFIVNEDTVDEPTGGGQATAAVKVWPAQKVAAIPAGDGQIGDTAFAPVLRAMQILGIEPGAPIDVNGMTAYRETVNGGRGLNIDVQANALTVPNEQRVAVISVGV